MQYLKSLQCTSTAIRNDVPYQIWDAVSSSGENHLPLVLVRLLHNKLRYFTLNYLQCYVYYLSPQFIVGQIGIINTFLLLLSVFLALKAYPRLKLTLITLIVLYPLFMILELYRGSVHF